MAARSLIWILSATISYKDGSWRVADMWCDNTGYWTSGPNVTRLPEISRLLSEMGIETGEPTQDPTIEKVVYRFSAIHAEQGRIHVVGDTESVEVISDSLASIRGALTEEPNFARAFVETARAFSDGFSNGFS